MNFRTRRTSPNSKISTVKYNRTPRRRHLAAVQVQHAVGGAAGESKSRTDGRGRRGERRDIGRGSREGRDAGRGRRQVRDGKAVRAKVCNVVQAVDDIGTVRHQHHFLAVGHRNAGLPRHLDRNLSGRSVVVDEVQLLVGRDNEVGVSATRARQLDVHVTSHARRAVRDGDTRVCTRGYRLSDVARDGLFNQRTEVGIGGITPRTGLVSSTNKLDGKVS